MEKIFEIVVMSGKGGTGKTCITAGFSAIAKNTVYVDCDVDASNLHLILSPDVYHHETFSSGSKAEINQNICTSCGLCEILCQFQAVSKNDKGIFFIDSHACEGCGFCVEACTFNAITLNNYQNNHIYFSNCRFGKMVHGKLGIAEENSGKLVAQIRQYAKKIAVENKSAYILVDGPPGIGCPAISSVTGADLVIAVTEPTLSGWHDLQRLIEMVEKFNTFLYVIINKYDLNNDLTGEIEKNLNKLGIRVIGKIPFDESVVRAMLEGKSINEFEPEGEIAQKINEIWKYITLNNIYESKCI